MQYIKLGIEHTSFFAAISFYVILLFSFRTSILSQTETSVVHVISFHPTNTHLEGGHCYPDKFSKCLRLAVILTLITLAYNEMGTGYI